MWSPFGCSCQQTCRSYISRFAGCAIPTTRIRYNPSGLKYSSHPIAPPLYLAQVEVLVIKFHRIGWPSNLLDHLSCLKALSWPETRRLNFVNATIQHNFHLRLTHLKVELHWADLYSRQRPLVFHPLQFLDFTVLHGTHCNAQPGHLDLATWAEFPVLHSLHLAVSVTHAMIMADTGTETQRKWDEVISLLKGVGPTLTGLTLDLPNEWRAWFRPGVWLSLPSLLEFGYKQYLPTTNHPSPPEDMHPLNILFRLDEYAPSPAETSSDQTLFDDFLETCRRWRTRRITMLQTWKEAERVLLSPINEWDCRRLPKRIDFYERVGALGVEICDRDGVHVTEAPGARFLEVLKNYEVKLLGFRPRVWVR